VCFFTVSAWIWPNYVEICRVIKVEVLIGILAVTCLYSCVRSMIPCITIISIIWESPSHSFPLTQTKCAVLQHVSIEYIPPCVVTFLAPGWVNTMASPNTYYSLLRSNKYSSIFSFVCLNNLKYVTHKIFLFEKLIYCNFAARCSPQSRVAAQFASPPTILLAVPTPYFRNTILLI
jgi:hypothetical protein